MLSDRDLSAARDRSIGFVFQQFNLLDGLTALDNVATAAAVPRRAGRRTPGPGHGCPRTGRARPPGHAPARPAVGRRAASAVAIARAIVGDPAIVLADEPTGNLDTRTGAEIFQLLRDLNASGTTVIVITHDLALARSLPRCVAIRDGRLEGEGQAAEALPAAGVTA